MKKRLLLMFLLTFLCVVGTFAEDAVEIDGIYYKFSESGAAVSESPSGYSGDVVIPDSVEYEGKKHVVFTINAYAFYKCSKLTSVVLPPHVRSIATQSFQDCSALRSITMPPALEFVMTYAFENCYGLEEVHISDLMAWCNVNFFYSTSNPLSFAKRLFLNDEEIKDLVIPEGVKSISNCVFSNCGVGSVTFPSSLERIGDYAFSACINIQSVQIPDGVTSIGTSAFYGCSKLKRLSLGAGVKTIGKNAFNRLSLLERVECHAVAVPETAENAFENTPIGSLPLLVPVESAAAYQTTLPWKSFWSVGDETIFVPRPYAVESEDKSQITFYYDTNQHSRSGRDITEFFGNIYGDVEATTLIIDKTFANYRPSTTIAWFMGWSNLKTIFGLENLNMEGVTKTSSMFQNCTSLTSLDLSVLSPQNVTDMSGMFAGCSNLTTIYVDEDKWTTAAVSNSDGMFDSCNKLKGGSGTTFNVGNDDQTYACVDKAGQPGYFTQKRFGEPTIDAKPYVVLSNDNTQLTFYYDEFKEVRGGMNVDRNNWKNNAGKGRIVVFDDSFAYYTGLTSTAQWFSSCGVVGFVGLENLKTDNVTDMKEMFYQCAAREIDVTGFNTSKVTNMFAMFGECFNLETIDVRHFNIAKGTEINYMFYSCSRLKTIYCDNTWDALSSADSPFYFCTALTGYDSAKTSGDYAKPIADGGYFTPTSEKPAKEPYALLSNDNKTVTFYYDENRKSRKGYEFAPDWAENLRWGGNGADVTTAVFDSSFAGYTSLTSTASWFKEWKRLTTIVGLENLNTSKVTDMSWMFYNCGNLKNLDVRLFDTRKVNNMANMFCGCSSLTALDVSGFDTGSVTSMNSMFSGCSGLSSLDVSHFNTSNVTNIVAMFYGCSNLTSLDLRRFDMSKLTSFNSMFSNCTSLATIYCNSAWTSSKEDQVFWCCTSLSGYTKDINDSGRAKLTADGGYFTFKALQDECAKPVISLKDNEMLLTCDTEDVVFKTTISKESRTNTVELGGKYVVSVVATKTGYDDSMPSNYSIELNDGSATLRGDIDGNGKVDIVDVTELIDIVLGR